MIHNTMQRASFVNRVITSSLICLLWLTTADSLSAQMAMGFRVGEVDQTSAIVWTRVTQHAQRKFPGHREPQKREPKSDEYVPSSVKVEDREGAVPGAKGEVKLRFSTHPELNEAQLLDWTPVDPSKDFTHQFQLTDLKPGTKYYLEISVRPEEAKETITTQTGSFITAAEKNQWQDVRFTVITGKSYWDLDDPQGYHIYPAMQKINPQFIIPTGDTVYYDNEAPRARTEELARFHWHRMYSLPRIVEFHRFVPGYWEKDDHDTWVNDCWPGQEAKWMLPLTFSRGQELFREQVPIKGPTYRTIRWGSGLQIWLVEGRDYRSPNTDEDGPEKTIWGTEQKAWLKKTLLESDAAFRVLISPTPIVGPDRGGKADNHANKAFQHEGDEFRNWVKEQQFQNFFVCCGDRHWQYMSVDETGLREFSCGPASDEHAGGTPGQDMQKQPYHRVIGGFLSVNVSRRSGNRPYIAFRHHGVHGQLFHEFVMTKQQ